MKNNDINVVENSTEEIVKTRKKQKAPLGVRPSDYIENRFKEEASSKGLSQTELFERVFWDYLKKSSDEYRNSKLDCSLELQNVNGAATTLVKAIQSIVSKSQTELIRKDKEVNAIQEATEKKIELATLQQTNKIAELEEENKKLEDKLKNLEAVIEGFNTIKQDLEDKNTALKEDLDSKVTEIESLKEDLKERDKSIKNLEKERDNAVKEVALAKEENSNIKRTLATTESNNKSLQDTLNSLNSMKAVEINAIKENEATISQLKISAIETTKNIEIEKLNVTVSSLESTLATKDLEINNLKTSIQTLEATKTSELETLREAVATLNSSIEIKENENIELRKSLSAKEKATKSKEKK